MQTTFSHSVFVAAAFVVVPTPAPLEARIQALLK